MAQRIAVVTGGMGGLGEAICIKLGKMGYRVIATYSPGNTKHGEWIAEMKRGGHDFKAIAVDVADYESCQKAAAAIQAEHGPVDVLVNNAGITRDMTFKKMDKPSWDAVMRTNLDSVFNMTKLVIDGMADRGWGRVINVSSVNGQKGAFGQTNYSAAKAGMHGFTKAAALEYARKGVTVNTATSAPRWCWRYRRRSWTAKSFPRFRWAASASPKKSPGWWPICAPTRPRS
jgi:acetoacetyl-CoA reductase